MYIPHLYTSSTTHLYLWLFSDIVVEDEAISPPVANAGTAFRTLPILQVASLPPPQLSSPNTLTPSSPSETRIYTMDKSDLEEYQLQLTQVETALEADPDNAELASLRSELKQLIELTQAAIAQAEAAAAASSSKQKSSSSAAAATPQHTWSAGDDCLARYSGDGQWYPARITFVGGAPENHVYSIVFKGYNTTELVKSHELKPFNPNKASHAAGADHGAGVKRKLTKEEEEEREKKKKKNEKKVAMKAEKAKEQQVKQQSWQKFAKKSEKKGQAAHIAGVVGKSIFKTPDNPMGKGTLHSPLAYSAMLLISMVFREVGVTGSGRGMTEVAGKSKHKFEYRADDS